MNLRTCALLAATVAVAFVCPSAVAAQDVARMVEVVRARAAATPPFMGTVLVAQGDRVVLDQGFGFANLEWRVPVAPSTRFRLGSVTKQFTAAVVLRLEEQGRLSVTDAVRMHVADLPDAWASITIEHLLSHTSGIPNYTASPDYMATSILPVTTRELVARFRDRPLEFEPGSQFRYSNSGYALLGLLIETVTGRSYAQVVASEIFEPLGMRDSGYDSHTDIIERRASGYQPGPSGLINAPYLDMSVPHAAGALHSTTRDLLTWQRALHGGKVLSRASLEKMLTPRLGNYGFGITIPAGPRRVYQHGGGINGFATMLAYYPDTETTVVVLSNVAAPMAANVAADLGKVVHGESVQLPTERTEIALPPQALDAYVGTYQVQPGGTMYVRREGIGLTVQIVGQPQLPLSAESPTRFFLKVVDAQVEFVRDEAGAVTHLLLYQNGNTLRWNRTSDTAPAAAAPRTAVTVSPEILARYAGVYELKPGFDLTISVGPNGGLMGQATGQAAFPLLAESETTFFFEAAGLSIEFVRDAAGVVTHMIFEQGGGRVEAKKKG